MPPRKPTGMQRLEGLISNRDDNVHTAIAVSSRMCYPVGDIEPMADD